MIKREIETSINRINDTFRVLMVTGPRQVGKTTVLSELKPKEMNYVTLDDLSLREEAQTHPKLFLEEHPWPLLIDEAQYAPQLFSYIKINVDQENKKGMYWLTGSQQFSLMKNVTESLAGRLGIVRMNSFTYAEINNNPKHEIFYPPEYKKTEAINVNKLYEHIFKGGMPELYDDTKVDRKDFYETYIETYLIRDVLEQVELNDTELFKKFMVAVASRNGEQLNYSSIAKDIKVSDNTARSWLNILVRSNIVYLLEPYMNSKIKRLTHMPKIVFMDSGLCAYLAGWESARDLQMSSTAGHYLETFVVSEIVKSYNAQGHQLNISYYRDKEKNEIDLIFFKNNKLYPFEIKKTADPKKEMIKNFDKLEESGKEVESGGIICFYPDLMHLTEKHYIIPIASVINFQQKKD